MVNTGRACGRDALASSPHRIEDYGEFHRMSGGYVSYTYTLRIESSRAQSVGRLPLPSGSIVIHEPSPVLLARAIINNMQDPRRANLDGDEGDLLHNFRFVVVDPECSWRQ